LRFCPLQRSLARDALSRTATLWTIPLRRFLGVLRPRVRGRLAQRSSPLRFYALRTRCGVARHAELPIAGLALSRCAASSRRAQWCFAMSATLRSPVRTAVGESDSIVRHERPVTSSATAKSCPPPAAGHASTRSLGAMFRYRLPGLRGLAGTSGPSLCSSGGAPGVLKPRSARPCPSQVCSRSGWATISGRPGPPAFRPARAPRLIFVGSIPPPA
jgi:hypothetical protein